MSSLTAKQAVELPPQLILECATGLEEWPQLAAKFGLSPVEWSQLEAWPPFVTAVESKRAELQRAGVPFRLKAGLAAEDLLADVYKRAMGPDVSLLQKLEALKLTAKLADYEPKQNVAAGGTGQGFSIVINLPSSNTGQPSREPVTIDATAREVIPVRPVLPIYMLGDTPEILEVAE